MMIDKKLINFVADTFEQGDTRYCVPESSILVADFIQRKAIDIDRKGIDKINIPKGALEDITPPQRHVKYLALKILEKHGAKFIGFELRFQGGRVDILAELNGKTITVECGPCRTDKAIDYLRKENTELWIITNYFNESSLTRVKRGLEWGKTIEKYDEYITKEIANEYEKKLANMYD